MYNSVSYTAKLRLKDPFCPMFNGDLIVYTAGLHINNPNMYNNSIIGATYSRLLNTTVRSGYAFIYIILSNILMITDVDSYKRVEKFTLEHTGKCMQGPYALQYFQEHLCLIPSTSHLQHG